MGRKNGKRGGKGEVDKCFLTLVLRAAGLPLLPRLQLRLSLSCLPFRRGVGDLDRDGDRESYERRRTGERDRLERGVRDRVRER